MQRIHGLSSILMIQFLLYRMPQCDNIMNRKCRLVTTVWGFIVDGTLCHTCRPIHHQKVMYSGNKRAHGIELCLLWLHQTVFLHDGCTKTLRHDAFDGEMTDRVNLLYADPAYCPHQSANILGGFWNPPNCSREAQFNTNVSSVRESVK